MEFSFLDVSEKKGLSEDMVPLAPLTVSQVASKNELPERVLVFAGSCCQIQTDNNTKFALLWLPSFALDQPTEKETKAIWYRKTKVIMFHNIAIALMPSVIIFDMFPILLYHMFPNPIFTYILPVLAGSSVCYRCGTQTGFRKGDQ